MSGKRLTFEQLVDMYYQQVDEEKVDKNDLLSDDDFRRDYDSLIQVLDQIEQLPEPMLEPADKVDIFENAWSVCRPESSMFQQVYQWFTSMVWKPAVSFSLGILFGIGISFALWSGALDISQPVHADVELKFDSIGSVETIQGTVLQELYPNIENPMLVLEPDSSNPSSSKRILTGTINDGSIQVVWNL
jgi:hypothetical protein